MTAGRLRRPARRPANQHAGPPHSRPSLPSAAHPLRRVQDQATANFCPPSHRLLTTLAPAVFARRPVPLVLRSVRAAVAPFNALRSGADDTDGADGADGGDGGNGGGDGGNDGDDTTDTDDTRNVGLAARARCAALLLAQLRDSAPAAAYLGATFTRPHDPLAESRALASLEDMLNVFSDSYLNRHLIFALLELFLVSLLPELADRPVDSRLEDQLQPGQSTI